MHSKWRYKICICSVFLKLKKGLSIIFQKMLAHYESETFLVSLSITFLNLKILGFLSPTKNNLTWG